MTPDELPADMEGRLAYFADWLRPGGTEPCCYTSARIRTDLRALLKAYQEQRRALEEARIIVFDATMEDRYPSLAVEIFAQIDAALTGEDTSTERTG
jgi:hypothetical protein